MGSFIGKTITSGNVLIEKSYIYNLKMNILETEMSSRQSPYHIGGAIGYLASTLTVE